MKYEYVREYPEKYPDQNKNDIPEYHSEMLPFMSERTATTGVHHSYSQSHAASDQQKLPREQMEEFLTPESLLSC